MADAAKMPKNTAPLLACLLPAAAKGCVLGFGPRVASCVRASERCSDENKHQQQHKKGTEKKKEKREHPFRALLSQFSYIFL
jgi:hypothetical protein